MVNILENAFGEAMWDVYRRAWDEAGYRAVRFMQMLDEHGGLETARLLIHANGVSDGYTALWQLGRLDLTVEALILHDEWHPLFTEDERKIARKRLKEYKYEFIE